MELCYGVALNAYACADKLSEQDSVPMMINILYFGTGKQCSAFKLHLGTYTECQ